MELKVGMYIRFNYHRVTVPIQIAKIKEKHYEEIEKYYYYLTDNGLIISEENIIKSSKNIIDLIEKKDIILGKDGNIYEVSKVFKGYVYTKTKTKEGLVKTLVDYQIDKVLTHEQFENNAYEVK